MTDTTFKFRFVNEIVGVFVLLAVAVLAAAVFLAGRAQGIFEPAFRLHTTLGAGEGTYGLKSGSEVRIGDIVAGSVARIRPTAEGTIEAVLSLKESFHGFVRRDSAAVVKKTLLVAGDSYVDISVGGRGEPLLPDGGRIPCTADRGIAERASAFLEEFRAKGLPTLERLDTVLEQMPAFMTQTGRAMREHEIFVEELRREDIHGTMAQFKESLREAQVLFEAMERHWALRGYVEPPQGGAPDAPAAGAPGGSGS